MAIFSMLAQQISEIHQKPTLLGSDPQDTSSCSTLDKIAIIEGMMVLPIIPTRASNLRPPGYKIKPRGSPHISKKFANQLT
jgi:hypothetical protein